MSQVCEACGGTILAEHVDQGRAGRWGGKLLCAVCYAARRSPAAASPSPPAPAAAPTRDEPLRLVEPPPEGRAARTAPLRPVVSPSRRAFQRKTSASGQGACRVRTFHGKLQSESLEFLDQAINEWLDANPDIEVKFVTSNIGVLSGKHPEPNLILNVWY